MFGLRGIAARIFGSSNDRRIAKYRGKVDAIAGRGNQLPADLNVGIPRSWLFLHRWSDGGRCPRTGALLRRDTIGGRTSCWSPGRQRLQ